MSAFFHLLITDDAIQDAEAAYHYLYNYNPEFAAIWWQGLKEKIATLEHFPERCAYAREHPAIPDLRQLNYHQSNSSYRILFRIHENTVHVLAIWHSSRDLWPGEIT